MSEQTREHKLKTWPEFFERIIRGDKRAEFRLDDRGFAKGDVLTLQEWSPNNLRYSGRKVSVVISDIVRGPHFGIPDGYCMMSFKRAKKDESK